MLERPSLDYFLSLKYPISIYPEDEGGYTALITDLPGCITQGETLEEVVINIEEARELWIETVYYSGKKEIPLPSRKMKKSRYNID
ncbi:type II toxin-antitoxin system HicB family antitoxin [Crocosphaera sp. UHCC 0190]|uniref:type II toxin-antitoxin system HicB family antitoxin n=1 Tax=Crocosphaera sp. UHCC 0190 TaxID=3110246 RepID=UPI002B203608|nr:type II toxin-antitoxin system HicB family antitoxin [Crocosphaera sp. UHCC 0190]MEA5510612.1 type II toxin-antitoxin system HicB family antitoxin [Crocosphaera sp. UHCC 0190]